MTPLAKTLKRESEAIARFIVVLEREQVALNAGETDSLSGINSEKAALVAELNALEAERAAHFPGAASARSKPEIQSWFLKHPAEKQASLLWGQLLELARKARDLHEANAALVAVLLQRTGEALDILMQRQKDHSLYGSDGQTAAMTGSRIVDSA